VKDSKLLTPSRRRFLFKEIKKVAKRVHYERIEPRAIDDVVLKGKKLFRLNYLEAKSMARVLSKLEFDTAYVDCCDTNQKRFGMLVADLLLEERLTARNNGKKRGKAKVLPSFKLGEENPLTRKIKSEHHADRNYPVVSAASIVAKVTRDAAVKRLHTLHGIFGSGYPSDPETLKYLRGFVLKSENLPSFTRLSWATVAKLYTKVKEPAIDDFPKEEERKV
jgi:ribonuclease HII